MTLPKKDNLLVRLAKARRASAKLSRQSGAELALAVRTGIAADDLEAMVTAGAGGADLLYERLSALGLNAQDVETVASGLLHILEKRCKACTSEGQCRKDFTLEAGGQRWQAYCPNAVAIGDVVNRLRAEAKGP